MAKTNYDAKTDALLAHTGDFEREDFLRAALAMLDQAGVSAMTQETIEIMAEFGVEGAVA